MWSCSVLLGVAAAVAEVGEGDGAVGGVEADDPAGEGPGVLEGPVAAVELGEDDVLPVGGPGDQPDAVATHGALADLTGAPVGVIPLEIAALDRPAGRPRRRDGTPAGIGRLVDPD